MLPWHWQNTGGAAHAVPPVFCSIYLTKPGWLCSFSLGAK